MAALNNPFSKRKAFAKKGSGEGNRRKVRYESGNMHHNNPIFERIVLENVTADTSLKLFLW